MPVDSELQPMLEVMSGGPLLKDVPLADLRQGPSPIPTESPAPLPRVENRTIPTTWGSLPVRLYYPRLGAPLPLLVYFHGGGFVLGNLESHDALLRLVALGADCIVASVDYRLAPEHRFPAAADDALAAARWAYTHAAEIGADPHALVVGGDSAGGNLATVAALRVRDEGGPELNGQLLVYPVTQLRAPRAGSMARCAEGYFLRASDMEWFADMYLGDSRSEADPHASPLLAPDLRGLPPALLITAEFDPLHDQGRAYATRLSAAGVNCEYSHYLGAIHGFFGMPASIGRRAVAESCAWLKKTFAA
jgi:acetyl esterase